MTAGVVKKKIQKASGTKSGAAAPVVKAIAPVAGAAGTAGKVGGILGGVSLGVDLLQGAQSLLGGAQQVKTMARDLLQAGGPIDISPGIPAGDIQVVDPDNIVINNATGKPAKLVPVGAKIQRRRRVRRGGVSRAEIQRMLESQKNTDMMQMMMMMALAKGH